MNNRIQIKMTINCFTGRKDIVDLLIHLGADVNHEPNDKNAAIIWGAVNGQKN